MPTRKSASKSSEAFIPNRHIFLTGLALLVASIGLVVYDLSIGETLFDGASVNVLGEHVTPTVSPYITPTNTP